jgi:predicted CXXCH cytochrome family protein
MPGFPLKNLGIIFCLSLCAAASSINSARAESCTTSACHKAIADIPQQHAPVKDGDCTACHRQKIKEHPATGGKSFELTAKDAALCYQCHDPFGKKKVVHPPVKDGDCTACHKPHGASGRFLLEVGNDRTDLCLGCHDGAPFKKDFMHGPAAVGACTKCHDPHEASGKFLLNAPIRDICLQCHADFAKSFNMSPVIHPPVKNGPCTVCHNPHGGNVRLFLKEEVPRICFGCHPHIEKKLAAVKFPHKPLQEQGGCSNCHSTHYAKAKGLLAGDEVSVCLSCHGKDNLGTPPLRNIAKEIEKKKLLHGPIQKGKCTACHSPHGSEFPRLLGGSYPAQLYVPYRDGLYDACLNCHNKNLIRSKTTTTDTNFRNGSRNLHFVHVANESKGRSCRVCHEPHASNGEKLLRVEGLKFGEWNIPLNFTISPSGGSCAPGCHRPLRYDRVNPQTY